MMEWSRQLKLDIGIVFFALVTLHCSIGRANGQQCLQSSNVLASIQGCQQVYFKEILSQVSLCPASNRYLLCCRDVVKTACGEDTTKTFMASVLKMIHDTVPAVNACVFDPSLGSANSVQSAKQFSKLLPMTYRAKENVLHFANAAQQGSSKLLLLITAIV
jgi:hypothetical protein